MRYYTLVILLSVVTSLQAIGGTAAPDHREWSTLLQRHVTAAGKVDYHSIKSDARFELYLLELEGSHPDATWSRNEQMAYWINAYNAFTVKLILDNSPINSIKDITDPWDLKFIRIEGKMYSLNQIEHEILRPQFKDPRIHFAVNCASASCPPLLNKAFTSSGLDSQLDRVTRDFLNNSKYNQISTTEAKLSAIFDWFASDFTAKGGVKSFINKYSKTSISSTASISYLDYDWSLND